MTLVPADFNSVALLENFESRSYREPSPRRVRVLSAPRTVRTGERRNNGGMTEYTSVLVDVHVLGEKEPRRISKCRLVHEQNVVSDAPAEEGAHDVR